MRAPALGLGLAQASPQNRQDPLKVLGLGFGVSDLGFKALGSRSIFLLLEGSNYGERSKSCDARYSKRHCCVFIGWCKIFSMSSSSLQARPERSKASAVAHLLVFLQGLGCRVSILHTLSLKPLQTSTFQFIVHGPFHLILRYQRNTPKPRADTYIVSSSPYITPLTPLKEGPCTPWLRVHGSSSPNSLSL